MEKYPYNHDYTMRLSIGYSNASRDETTNPSKDSSYSQEEWEALSDEEKQDWLNSELDNWSVNFIETSVTP